MKAIFKLIIVILGLFIITVFIPELREVFKFLIKGIISILSF